MTTVKNPNQVVPPDDFVETESEAFVDGGKFDHDGDGKAGGSKAKAGAGKAGSKP